MSGWGHILVDLDGTLAHHDQWLGVHHIGEPIPDMVDRVRAWISDGIDVRIFTARVCGGDPERARPYVESWCVRHLGVLLKVTAEKDFNAMAIFDDRAVAVEPNTGRLLSPDTMAKR